jgi:hypothetical protein
LRAIRARAGARPVGETYNIGGWNEKPNSTSCTPSARCSTNAPATPTASYGAS